MKSIKQETLERVERIIKKYWDSYKSKVLCDHYQKMNEITLKKMGSLDFNNHKDIIWFCDYVERHNYEYDWLDQVLLEEVKYKYHQVEKERGE